MYKEAIKKSINYTIPIISGIKYYNCEKIFSGIATLIVVNKDGWLLTCRHVAEQFLVEEELKKKYPKILEELKSAINCKVIIHMLQI